MTCGRPLKAGQWWHFCGETDMGQTAPALCTNCGGPYELAPPGRQAEHEAHKARVAQGVYFGTYTGNGSTQTIPNGLSANNCIVIIKQRGQK